jgi:hemoglobin
MTAALPARSFAEDKRAEIWAKAAEIGVDEAYISRLVECFYARVRTDAMLGPIFERAIKVRWERHLARMKAFWASVALNAGTYSGRPVPVHQRLEEVTARHYGRWLALFRESLEETTPSTSAVEFFMVRAERIVASLQMAMFERLPETSGEPPVFTTPRTA